MTKSSIEEIRARFDDDVERFSNLESGQSATMDAPLSLELISQVAAATNPDATHLLDIGCGAGNYTLKMLSKLPNLNVTLVDLSQPMLQRAVERIQPETSGELVMHQSDIRALPLPESYFDIILAAAVFHHLRDDDDWQNVFAKCFDALKPGGSIWISDLIDHESPPARNVMWRRYGEYLSQLRDESYRDHVFAYIEKEDSPRSLLFQIDMLRKVGFQQVEILHKNGSFAAFGAVK